MSEQAPLEAWRRRLRISVRGLMILVLLLGGGLGWFSHKLRMAQFQHDAVSAINRMGGSAHYDSEWSNPSPPVGALASRRPLWPKWLVDRAGADIFLNVLRVYLARGASDAELVHVGSLSRLESLVVHPSTVTDAGLVHLKGLTHLSNLQLPGSKVAGEGLVYLEGMNNLQMLILWDTEVSDAGEPECGVGLRWRRASRERFAILSNGCAYQTGSSSEGADQPPVTGSLQYQGD